MAKTLGIVGAVGAPLIGIVAYGFYSAGKPTYAVIWGAMALVWAVCSIINFRTARRH